MLRSADLVGLAGSVVAIAAALLSLPGARRLHRARPAPAVAVALAAALLPLGGLPLAGYLRGVVGDLSVSTVVLLLLRLRPPDRGREAPGERSRAALQAAAAACGLLLYPMTLGLGPFDPYRLGYGDPWLLAALFALATLALHCRLHLPAVLLSLAVLAWAASLGESRNLWDYLLDPLLAAWGLGTTAARLARGRLRRERFPA
jgi:hypothetical protein